MSDLDIPDPKLFGKIAVQKEYISKEDWKKAVALAEKNGGIEQLAKILVKKGYMDEERIESVIRKASRLAEKGDSGRIGETERRDRPEPPSSRRVAPPSEPQLVELSLDGPGGGEAPPAPSRRREKPAEEERAPPRPKPPAPELRLQGEEKEDDPMESSSTIVKIRDVATQRLSIANVTGMNPKAQPYLALLKKAAKQGASDIHIQSGAVPFVRMGGKIVYLSDQPILDAKTSEEGLLGLLTPKQKEKFLEDSDLDFSFQIPGIARFRSNMMRQYRGTDAIFRIIPEEVPTIADLGLPEEIGRFTTYHQGLVLCTGPAGCGKSTTMAALVNKVNGERHDHIITIEDPIEYVFKSQLCLINQREVGRDTDSFGNALRASLREDPDVIMVGELRDRETIGLAITAAETGHLVFGTLHTNNAIRTINRLTDAFPHEQQAQIRSMVSESLRGVISQYLIPSKQKKGLVAAVEVLFMTPAVSNIIRDNRTFQIKSLMQTGRKLGMRLMDQSLQELVAAGTIEKEDAKKLAEDPNMIR